MMGQYLCTPQTRAPFHLCQKAPVMRVNDVYVDASGQSKLLELI